jgi:hypothetical protein
MKRASYTMEASVYEVSYALQDFLIYTIILPLASLWRNFKIPLKIIFWLIKDIFKGDLMELDRSLFESTPS